MSSTLPTPSSPGRTAFAYGAMLLVAAAGFLWIRSSGASLVALQPAGPSQFGTGTASAAGGELLHVLLALVLVIVTARAVGFLFRLLHQPQVIGEMVAGLVLGPSVLGRIAPEAWAFLLPPDVTPYLGVLAQVG